MTNQTTNEIATSELMIASHPEYKQWLIDLKHKVAISQIKAAIKVNSELLNLYWELGADIVLRQHNAAWGDKLLTQLSRDLSAEFPEIKGFSKRNLEYIRRWFLFWRANDVIAKQVVSQLMQIPWGHNFKQTLPAVQSDLAIQTLKDPYIFDFLSLSKQHSEHELEQGLVDHITAFLLELGAGFAYMGRQYPISVGERDFYIDLLFYHARLHCYVVIELKLGDFEPEHAGKLNFYIKAVDAQLCKQGDAPTIGILLCKTKDKVVAEYALSDINKPMGIAEYRLTKALPDELKADLPSVEALAQLGGKNE